jgi:hypothetical protein
VGHCLGKPPKALLLLSFLRNNAIRSAVQHHKTTAMIHLLPYAVSEFAFAPPAPHSVGRPDHGLELENRRSPFQAGHCLGKPKALLLLSFIAILQIKSTVEHDKTTAMIHLLPYVASEFVFATPSPHMVGQPDQGFELENRGSPLQVGHCLRFGPP